MQPSIASESLVNLFTEIHKLASHLKHSRQPLQIQEDWPSGVRSVLLILGRNGAQTVPDIAHERSTSRQNIQIVVNRLKKAGLAEFEINPAHKRSAFIRLTEKGRLLLNHLEEAEATLQESILAQLSPEDLASTTNCLRRVSHLLAGDSKQHRAKRQTPRLTTPPVAVYEAPTDEDAFPVNLL